MLFASYPSAGEGPGELKTQLGLCEMAVSGVPAEFVERACMAFIQGNVAGHNPSFRPKPSEIGSYARKLFERDSQSKAEAARIQRQLEAPKEPEPTPEERARVRDTLAKAKAAISQKVAADMIGQTSTIKQ